MWITGRSHYDGGSLLFASRYQESGALDLVFGSGGYVFSSPGRGGDSAGQALCLSPKDGTVTVGAYAPFEDDVDYVLLRYWTGR